jgi:hypothetical protein
MSRLKLPVIAIMVGLMVSTATAQVFSDDFDDGDISDWMVTTTGDALLEVSTEKYVSLPYSLHMKSTGDYKAMAVSPLYDLELTEDYIVSFDFMLPDTNNHWFEVFNNHQVYLVIDSPTGLRCYKEAVGAQHIMTLNTDQWYRILISVHPSAENYDVFIDTEYVKTCPFWIHTGFEDTFRLGDRADGFFDRGQAYWDNIEIIQQSDSDGDDVPDANDNCPSVYNPKQKDSDRDGVGNKCDSCPGTPHNANVNEFGCLLADLDGDEDTDLFDLAILGLAWSTERGHPGWDPNCDISIPPDYKIDSRDLASFVGSWPIPLSVDKYAILIGGATDSWNIDAIKYAYQVVSGGALNYDDENIFFIAPERYDYQGPHYYTRSAANVKSAIDEVAGIAGNEDSVFTYVVAHGSSTTFTVGPNSIKHTDFGEWLDGISCKQMVVVYDSCKGQNLINALKDYNGNVYRNRIIVTATGQGNNAWWAEADGYYKNGMDPNEPNMPPMWGTDPNPWDKGMEFSSGFFEAFYMNSDSWSTLWRNLLIAKGDLSPNDPYLPEGPPSWYFPGPGGPGGGPYLVADKNDDELISVNEAFIYTAIVDEANPILPYYDETHGWWNPYWNELDYQSGAQPHIWGARDEGYSDAIDANDVYL